MEEQGDSTLQDALDIERVAASLIRPTAKARLADLVQKLKLEAAKAVTTAHNNNVSSMDIEESVAPSEKDFKQQVFSPPAPVIPPRMISNAASLGTSLKYKTIESFSFDLGGYNSPTVSIYVEIPNIGTAPREKISCEFTATSFDLKVLDHPAPGHNYRLLNDSLDKEIDPALSKYVVKANKIILKLQKKKGEYGSYDYWSDLNSKKTKTKKSEKENDKSKDPSASIMELMKDMYDSGDDNMRKIIGETMMKQREGKLGKDNKPFGMDDDDFKM